MYAKGGVSDVSKHKTRTAVQTALDLDGDQTREVLFLASTNKLVVVAYAFIGFVARTCTLLNPGPENVAKRNYILGTWSLKISTYIYIYHYSNRRSSS